MPNKVGPLLFCNTVYPLLSSSQCILNIGFLDDVTLGGHVDVVASDVAEIIRLGAKIGLSLNISKCELIAHTDLQLNDALLQSFSRVDIAATTLLGAPLFHGPILDNTRDQRCDDLSKAVNRLSSSASQDALIFLTASFSAPKFYICCDVRRQCLIHLSRSLMLCSNRQSSASPILTSPSFSGSRPVF